MSVLAVHWSEGRRTETRTSCFSMSLGALLALLLASAGFAFASDSPKQKWGTTASPTAANLKPLLATSIGRVLPESVFTSAQIATGGVSLRNRVTGSVGISGAFTPVQAAFLYWAVITKGPAPISMFRMFVRRLSPAASGTVTVVGEVVGKGPQPCWIGDTITVFKASIPLTVATGNGLYQIRIPSNALGGNTEGGDPWVEDPVLPLWEGASIVMVGTGSGTVAIYDESVAGFSALSGQTFLGNPGVTYTLVFPGSVAATGLLTLLDNIGADGQIGSSRTATAGVADEATTVNGVLMAGPGSAFNDSDWNGSSSFPLGQLWDDTGHDITAATPSGTTSLLISIANLGEPASDCVTPTANVLEIH